MENPNQDIYANVFGDQQKHYNEFMSLKQKKISRFISNEARMVLDIGCGDGSSKFNFDQSVEYHGVDFSDTALAKAAQAGIITKKVDLNQDGLPYADGTFDIIICADILEHLLFPERMLAEAHRVLRSGGFLISAIPNVTSWVNRLVVPLGFFPWGIESTGLMPLNETLFHFNAGHVRAFNKRTVRNLYGKIGFSRLQYLGSSFKFKPSHVHSMLGAESPYLSPPRIIFGMYNAVDRFFSHFPALSTFIIVKACK